MATEQQQQQQHAMKSPRPLVYDVDTGTLRFFKTTPTASQSKSPARSRSSPLNAADQERTSAEVDGKHKLLGCGVESGESSPTCVIQNSAVRSNSSSPTMSSISKASHDQEGRRSYSASSTATTKCASPESGSVPGHKTPPFKSIQSAVADKTPESGTHKPKKFSNQSSSSIMHKARPGIFSFNATYMTRVDGDFDHGEARRTMFLAPLLKPTPSKWDDAEKWVPGSESLNSTLRAKSRSGPLLAQMVASQAGMLSMPFPSWKPRLQKPDVEDTPLEPSLTTATNTVATDSTHFAIDSDGGLSPSCMNGSFMNLGMRSLQSSTRDMGTAMTPPATSVVGTPVRDMSVVGIMTEEEIVEKTRQEIVALGTQLGKASIAAAWAHAARDHHEKDHGAGDGKTAQVVTFCGDGESRADAWKEAETAKLTIRFQQEEAKIAAWEEQEKAKAEAEMLRAEAKAERMKAQAHEKRANKVAATVFRGEKLRHDAETRRTEATAKVTRKAELMRSHGKFTNLLFLSFLCK